jgi:hypothetical protein
MTLTAEEHAWVLETERRFNDTARGLQDVAYMYSRHCIWHRDIREMPHIVTRSQRELAAVSLAERVLRGVERIGDI